MTFRCLIVAAVSTTSQAAEDKASLPEQMAQCRKVCDARGWHVVETVEIPGHSRNYAWLHRLVAASPEYARLVEVIESGDITLLLCWRYDRLWRTDALRAQLGALCRENGVQIYSLSQPVEPLPPERLVHWDSSRQALEMLSGYASQTENMARSQRVVMGMRNRIARGLYVASVPPYGYESAGPDAPMRVVPEHARWVRHVFEMRAEGHGYLAIRGELNRLGVLGPTGGRWTYTAVRGMLRRDAYIGTARWGDAVNHSALHEPIIDRDLWQRVQDVNAAHGAWQSRGRVYPLTGLIECGACGWGMGYVRSRQHVHMRCNRYARNRGQCRAGYFPAPRVHAYVLDAVRSALSDPRAWLEYRRREIDDGQIATEIAVLDRALADAAKRFARWSDLYERGGITADELLGHRDRIAAQTQDAQERRDALESTRVDLDVSAQRLTDLSSVVTTLDDLNDASLRELYGHILRRVILTRDKTTYHDPLLVWR